MFKAMRNEENLKRTSSSSSSTKQTDSKLKDLELKTASKWKITTALTKSKEEDEVEKSVYDYHRIELLV